MLVQAALNLASAFDAHLTALHTFVPSYYDYRYAGLETSHGLQVLLQEEAAQAEQSDVKFRKEFASQARRLGQVGTAWRYVDDEPDLARILALHARYGDMMVVSQHDPERSSTNYNFDTPAQAALLAARPMLIVPTSGRFGSIGKRILVAWNASREATRAVTAALPLLARADSVVVVVVDEGKHMNSACGDEPGADIALFLTRHKVKSTILRIPRGKSYVSDTLNTVLADQGSDLLCMGAYGHSRLRELVLGGVTRDIMRHMALPTLIAC